MKIKKNIEYSILIKFVQSSIFIGFNYKLDDVIIISKTIRIMC
jgi:hypothetical protein